MPWNLQKFSMNNDFRLPRKMTVYNKLSVKIEEHIHKEPTPTRKRWLNALDSLLSIFIVTPLVVGNWRGTWHLVEIHYKEYLPFWEAFILSTIFMLICTHYRQSLVDEIIHKPRHIKSFKKTFGRHVLNRIYHYIFNVSCITFWLSIWAIVPMYIGKNSRYHQNLICVKFNTQHRDVSNNDWWTISKKNTP